MTQPTDWDRPLMADVRQSSKSACGSLTEYRMPVVRHHKAECETIEDRSRETVHLRYLHWQNFAFLFSPIFFLSSLLVLLFCRNVDFETKYTRGDENSEAKICVFTGSQGHFRARTGSVVRLFIHLSVFLDDIFFLIAAFRGCFDRSSTVCLRGRHIWFEICPYSSTVKIWETGSLGRVWHLATHKQTKFLWSAGLVNSGNTSKMAAANMHDF